MKLPKFTLCPSARGTRCSIATLPANQAFELRVTDQVRRTATIGEPITVTVSADATSLSPASAVLTTVVSRTGKSPARVSLPPIPPLPPTTLQPYPGATIMPPSLGGLFPTVTPQASAPATEKQKHQQSGRATTVTQTSSALPLDPRLIGGQLAGLAALAAAITMVVARLSLRAPQPANPGPTGPPAQAEAVPADDNADDKTDQQED